MPLRGLSPGSCHRPRTAGDPEEPGKGTVLRAVLEQGINANEENEYLNKTFIKDRLTLSLTPHFCFAACAFRAPAQKPVLVFPGYI